MKNEYIELVSFDGQNITFRLSMKKIIIFLIHEMSKTILKSPSFSNKNETKTKPELNNTKLSLPSHLKTFKWKFSYGNGFYYRQKVIFYALNELRKIWIIR